MKHPFGTSKKVVRGREREVQCEKYWKMEREGKRLRGGERVCLSACMWVNVRGISYEPLICHTKKVQCGGESEQEREN